MDEEWRTIPEATRYEINIDGDVRNKKTGRILKPFKIGKTPAVSLMDAGWRITRSVNKLVNDLF